MSGEDIRIVLVEDNPHDARLITRVLNKHDLASHLVVLKDGAEALAFFLGEDNYIEKAVSPPRVILLDLKLPKVSGVEVLRRLKADERTRNIPVVILSSSSEQSDLEQAYESGANSFVTKPIKFAEFAGVVAEIGSYWLQRNTLPGRQ
jgi:CheY-like chemotaxis protein